jgi:hypothetical protein
VGNLREQRGSRLSRLDSLLPDSPPLPEPGPDDVQLDVPGGRGLARVVRADPTTLDGTWNPAERHTLTARIGADDPAAVLDTLLSRWSTTVHARAGEAESAAVLTWPSRDVELIPTFLAHGLAPRLVLAIRLAGRDSPDGAALPRTRPCSPSPPGSCPVALAWNASRVIRCVASSRARRPSRVASRVAQSLSAVTPRGPGSAAGPRCRPRWAPGRACRRPRRAAARRSGWRRSAGRGRSPG